MKYVLVDAVSMFRMRYAVAVPEELDDKTAKEWAMDSVTCEDVNEFSQDHIAENISSTRVVTKEELLKQFDEDNDYLVSWNDDMKMRCVCVINKDGDIVSGKADWNAGYGEKEKDDGIKDFVSTDGC